mmetsp:Transcript_142477/g.443061  ORF Transcript_142477/g.443061 Transcript_142477/m.443061 type:complete len:233 (+) Transcript_142477:434-1132(+)
MRDAFSSSIPFSPSALLGGMQSAFSNMMTGREFGATFISDQRPTPPKVMEKAAHCILVIRSPNMRHESTTMTMSFVRPDRTKPTAEISLMTVATRTFSTKATSALSTKRCQCRTRAGMMWLSQWQRLATNSTKKLRGAMKEVYVRGSNFLPVRMSSPRTTRAHSASCEAAWKPTPMSENFKSPDTETEAPTMTQTINATRSRFTDCKPAATEMRKTIMTLASFMNCKRATLQ